MCKWNLHRLAEALEPVLPLETSKKMIEQVYDLNYNRYYYYTMLKKLGFYIDQDGSPNEHDNDLVGLVD